MSAGVVGRQTELQGIGTFLDSINGGSGALILYGEAGIGKTTLWQEGIAEARRRGYAVLVSRPAQSEAKLSYSSIADQLADLDEAMLSALPAPQYEALDVVRLRSRRPHATVDRRVVATAFLAVLQRLADRTPALVAVDDFQWLDRASAQAIEFAARRVTGKIGFLVSFRTTARDLEEPAFRVAGPDGISRLHVGPLSLAAIQHVLRERFGRTYPHPALVRIHEASAGNPFLALELARVHGSDIGLRPNTRLSATLSELTGARLRGLDRPVHDLQSTFCDKLSARVQLLRLKVQRMLASSRWTVRWSDSPIRSSPPPYTAWRRPNSDEQCIGKSPAPSLTSKSERATWRLPRPAAMRRPSGRSTKPQKTPAHVVQLLPRPISLSWHSISARMTPAARFAPRPITMTRGILFGREIYWKGRLTNWRRGSCGLRR
ncbi:MAG: ATP-binding protein [Chloroflexi bacterium]|nr:MAG: ATP-binding protein [Chloroflexota bacterium]